MKFCIHTAGCASDLRDAFVNRAVLHRLSFSPIQLARSEKQVARTPDGVPPASTTAARARCTFCAAVQGPPIADCG